jgi:hypothetical protein
VQKNAVVFRRFLVTAKIAVVVVWKTSLISTHNHCSLLSSIAVCHHVHVPINWEISQVPLERLDKPMDEKRQANGFTVDTTTSWRTQSISRIGHGAKTWFQQRSNNGPSKPENDTVTTPCRQNADIRFDQRQWIFQNRY